MLKRKPILAILFFGILLETKAYAGVLVLGSLFVSSIYEYLSQKKKDYFVVFVGSSVLSLLLFFLLNSGSENVFIFSPFWFLQTLFGIDRFSIPKLFSAITNYNLARNYLKLTLTYILAFGIFWIGNMWTRLFKEFEVIKWIRHPKSIKPMDVFVTSMIISGALIPMLFIQKGTPWNTIQFFYYSLMFSAVLTGIALKNLKNPFLIIVIILLTIPTTIVTLRDVYIPGRPPAKISIQELNALDFLSKQTKGVVLTYPYDSAAAKAAESNPPRPLYLYDSTAYVAAFSNHETFLEDEVNLNITGFNWQTRRSEVKEFFKATNVNDAKNFLAKNNIKYIYLESLQKTFLTERQLGAVKIFENNEVNIFKIE